MENTLAGYKKGDKVYAKTEAVNAQWQLCAVVEDQTSPERLLVEFPDGSRFNIGIANIGGVAAAPVVEPNPLAPTTSLLPLPYEAFLQHLLELEAASMELFKLPVAQVLLMMQRQAANAEIVSTGSISQAGFIPDLATLRAWGESYLNEIAQRQNANQ